MTHTPVPCVGGPYSGREIALEDGRTEYCVRDRLGTWFRYVLRPDDTGMVLQFVGVVSKPPKHLPPIPSLW